MDPSNRRRKDLAKNYAEYLRFGQFWIPVGVWIFYTAIHLMLSRPSDCMKTSLEIRLGGIKDCW